MTLPTALDVADFNRIGIRIAQSSPRQSELGQYMTPAPIAAHMASLFQSWPSSVHLLDPGSGVGSLTAAFTDHAIRHGVQKLHVTAYEIDESLFPTLEHTLKTCAAVCRKQGVTFEWNLVPGDFIETAARFVFDSQQSKKRPHPRFTHAILNPPYSKLKSMSAHRAMLDKAGITTPNLYSAFMALSIELLAPGGEMVSITPRSFCNGAYFRRFRRFLLSRAEIRRIHVFESRTEAFKDDSVLQENVIVHACREKSDSTTVVTSSHGSDFAPVTWHAMSAGDLVDPSDPDSVIRLLGSQRDLAVSRRLSAFPSRLKDLGLTVSTGPVVEYRLREYTHTRPTETCVPLIHPGHMQRGVVNWPDIAIRKPNYIENRPETRKWLLPNDTYVVVRRVSAKEERRRIVATIYTGDPQNGTHVGIENHLNVIHRDRKGLPRKLAAGLVVYLNSTLVDQYFRLFSGHTQVNATDLRRLPYPDSDTLTKLAAATAHRTASQSVIDQLVEEECLKVSGTDDANPLAALAMIEDAIKALRQLGLPRAQQNERSALVLLGLLNLPPDKSWDQAEAPLMGTTPLMEFAAEHYGRQYAPNTRETVRRQTLHQFVDAGLVIRNPDEPLRPTNSPKTVYQIDSSALGLLRTYLTPSWDRSLESYLSLVGTLREQYAREREMNLTPVKTSQGAEFKLSPGEHSELIKAIVEEFSPRFAPGGVVAYVGDTGSKWSHYEEELLSELGVSPGAHGKMPDVVIYYRDKHWLLAIEAVTSHGPVDSKRRSELATLFSRCSAGIVYVTAFVSRSAMVGYLADISWETEVWVADAPSHLIHFDGERFLGPYTGDDHHSKEAT